MHYFRLWCVKLLYCPFATRCRYCSEICPSTLTGNNALKLHRALFFIQFFLLSFLFSVFTVVFVNLGYSI